MPASAPERTRELEGKVAVITGASRGIGAAVARAFSNAGAAVALAARDETTLARLAAELNNAGGNALAIPTDAGDPVAVAQLIKRTVAHFGRLDLACNNAAGGGHPPMPLVDVTLADYDTAMAVNLRGVFLAMKHEIPAMISTGSGAIVNMSSTAGTQAVAGLTAYVTSKHGLEGLTKVAALDYAELGIRINAIAPGPILTDNLKRAGTSAQQVAAAAMPMRRIGQPHEVAAAAVWLCSDAAAFITGSTLTIDGGKLAGTPIRRPQARLVTRRRSAPTYFAPRDSFVNGTPGKAGQAGEGCSTANALSCRNSNRGVPPRSMVGRELVPAARSLSPSRLLPTATSATRLEARTTGPVCGALPYSYGASCCRPGSVSCRAGPRSPRPTFACRGRRPDLRGYVTTTEEGLRI
jgi:NAD(P)-dependent dehydrogenase (short-subunit alcohol dehydrogenase family)